MRALAAVAFLAATAVHAEPLAFKDIVLGQPLGDGATAKRLYCHGAGLRTCEYKPTPQEMRESMHETIAGTLVRKMQALLTEDGLVDRLVVDFGTHAFDDVAAGLKTKYPSLQCKDSVVQNRAGASFDQIECSLFEDSGGLIAIKRAGSVDESRLELVSKARLQRAAERSKKSQKDL